MYLKRLQISGFKTFADNTELEFPPGITAIVGPNGTGKSNISDAIVWALGERSMKALRGSKPLDVIFTGNGGRKSVGMAEVSITLDNSDSTLPVEFNEVTVTRRIYRDGETGYMINKTPCRLRDIHELFFDTGIGAEAYSIVNQSGIDAVLSLRPEDRRELFEEAAGVKKYRSKRDEAKRKLERTEANLVRLRDILHEIESQLAPLAAQVELALEYENFLRRLSELRLALLAWEYDVRLKRTDNLRDQRATVEKQVTEGQDRITQLEEQEQSLDNKLREMEKEIAWLQQETTKVVSDVRSTEGQIAVAEERIRSFVDQKELLEQDTRILLARIANTRHERENLGRQLRDLEEECTRVAEEAALQEQQLHDLNAQIAARTGDLDGRKSDYIELMRAMSEKRNGIAAAEATANGLRARVASLESLDARTREELSGLQELQQEASEGLRKLGEQLSQVETRLDQATEELRDLEQLQEQHRVSLNEIREEISRVHSRLHALEEMEHHFEGLHAGVRSTLQSHRENRLVGPYHLVADILKVPTEYETALEVALGSALQNIVTEDDAAAKSAIEHLKETRGGRATFMPLRLLRITPPSANTLSLLNASGARGLATSLVAFEEEFRPAAEYLLNRVLIVDNLDTAIELSRRADSGLRLVTVAGELVVPGGAISGGRGKQTGGGLLARKREIGELRDRLAALKLECGEREQALESNRARIEESRDRVQSWHQEREEARTSQARQDREAEHLAQELRRIESAREQIELDRRDLQAEAEQSQNTCDQLRAALSLLEQEAGTLEQEIARAQTRSEADLSRREDLVRVVHEGRVSRAASEERLTGLRRQIRELEQATAESDVVLREKEQAISAGIEECEALTVQVAGDEMSLESLRESQKLKERAFDDWRRTRMETLDSLEEATRQLRQLRSTLHEAEMELHKIELRETQTQTEMEEMERRFSEDHETTPDVSLDRKDLIQNKQQALEEVETLRQKIEGLGEVNLGAISLQKQLSERLEFLSSQRNDLEKGKSELEQIIAEIDQRTRDQFMTTFEAVRLEFQRMFRRIFDGGETQLTLTNPDNLLETGIDITVQLPGKAQQDLLLLSGGERALTALALLLGLLCVKPSPFCVLDEVDAPLDETRVERFTEMLREFAQNSQFIVITHNRGTMEAADQLYGVTMEEEGVSKLVSVRLTGDK